MATFKKRLAIILAVCLVVMNTVPAFAATDIEPQTDLTETETVLEENADVEPASPSNAEYEEEELLEEGEEFFGEVKVGNVIITAKTEGRNRRIIEAVQEFVLVLPLLKLLQNLEIFLLLAFLL